MKTFKRILLAAIVLILLLGIGIYMAVKIALPPSKIREVISTKGSQALGRPIQVGAINVGLFPTIKLSVHDLKLANAPGFSPDPMVQVREVDLSLNFLSLLRFAPVIQQIKIVSPEFLYEVNAAGENNLAGLGGSTTTNTRVEASAPAAGSHAPSPLPEIPAAVALKSFVIQDGRVRYRDARSGREITLGRINQEVSLQLDPRLQDVVSSGKLEVTQIAVRDSASGLRQGNLRIELNHDIRLDLPGERLQIKKLQLGFQNIHMEMDGSISNFRTTPVVDLRIEAPAISLASVLKEVPAALSPEIPKFRVAGQASFQARIHGKLDSVSRPNVDAVLQVQDMSLHDADLPLGIDHLQLNLTLRHDSLAVNPLTFAMGPNPVRVALLITDLQTTPRLQHLTTDATLDLGALAALAQRLGLADSKMAVSGIEALHLQASGLLDPANPQKLSANGTAELRGVTLTLPGKPTLHADGRVQITNTAIHEQVALKVGKSDLAVTTEVSNYLALALPKLAHGERAKVRVQVHSALMDLDPFLPPPTLAPASAAEPSTTPALKAYPPLPPVDADVSVDLGKTRFLGLEMTHFQLHTTVGAKSTATTIKGGVAGGSFSAAVNTAWHSAADMGVAFKLKVANVEANDFISHLDKRVPIQNRLLRTMTQSDSVVFGKLNLNLDLTTHGLPQHFADNAAGTGVFSLLNGRLMETGFTRGFSGALSQVNSALGFHELAFGSMKGDLQVQNGNLLVKNFTMESTPVGSTQAVGQIGFDNRLKLQMTQALTPAASKVVAGVSGVLSHQLAKLVPGVGKVSLVPTDKAGHALLYFAVGGLLTNPSFSLDAKRMAQEGSGSAKSSLTNTAKAKIKSAVENKVQEEVKKQVGNSAEQAAKKQGRKVLKNLGF